jgi:hypothetical protein
MIIGSVCSGIGAPECACRKCGISKPVTAFHKQGRRGRHSWCKECFNAYARETRSRNYSSEQKQRWNLSRRYKMTRQAVAAMLDAQGGRCGICAGQLHKPHIDHDHRTGKVRGLLCHRCNIVIGGWEDEAFRTAALRWLERGE